jgi:hypothetical protein
MRTTTMVPNAGSKPAQSPGREFPIPMTATEGTVMPGWDLAFYQLTLESRGWSPHTVTHRASSAKVMAERLGHANPAEVTRRDMVAYVAADRARRVIGGHCTHYQDCKCYWDFWAAETGRPSPLTGVPRPKEPKEPPEVHVLTQAEMRRSARGHGARLSYCLVERRVRAMPLSTRAIPAGTRTVTCSPSTRTPRIWRRLGAGG